MAAPTAAAYDLRSQERQHAVAQAQQAAAGLSRRELEVIAAAAEGLISHRKSNEIWLYFEVQPDTVRIQCVPQNGGEVETITGILPYDGGYAFDLKSGSFVYRVIAEWDDGNRVEYGFIGKWL